MNNNTQNKSFFKSSLPLWMGLLFFTYGIVSISYTILGKIDQGTAESGVPIYLLLVGVVFNSICLAGVIFALLIHYRKVGPYDKSKVVAE